jgi:fucose permease
MAIFEDVQAVTIVSAFVVGMLLTLLGSIKFWLGRRLELSDTGVGWLLSALYLALVPMTLASGVFIDYHQSPKLDLFVGSLVAAMALFVLAVARNRAQALAAILLMAAGAACLSTGSIVLMPKAFFPDSPPAAALNLGNVFFALGALVTPPLAEILLRRLDFRRGIGVLAVLCLLPALFAGLAPHAAFDVGGAALPPKFDPAHVLGHPIVWLAGLVFLLYGPLESSVGTWGTTYLTHLGASEHLAALLLSGFWLTFLASRLGAAFLQHQARWASEPWLIVLLALGAGICLGNLAQAEKLRHARAGWLLLGAFLGPVFPTLVGTVFQFFPAYEHGTAYGAMFSIGSLGGLVLPPFVGVCVRRLDAGRAMRVPMVMALVLAMAALVFGVLKNLQLAQ